MALGYSISAKLDLLYNARHMQDILEKGLSLQCIYYERSDVTFQLVPVSIEHIISSTLKAINDNDIYAATMHVQNETYVELIFMNLDDSLGVMFLGMSPEWSKEYIDSDVDIDVQRYIRVFLDIINDYKIISMTIQKD